MLNEITKICSPNSGGIFVDCTFGGGEVVKNILKFKNTKVLAFDRDKFILISAKLEKNILKDFLQKNSVKQICDRQQICRGSNISI